VGRHGGQQGPGVVVGQAPAAQRLTGHPGQVVARGHLGHGVRHLPGPGRIPRGQREPVESGPARGADPVAFGLRQGQERSSEYTGSPVTSRRTVPTPFLFLAMT
jgi:hypothetical protein